MNWYPNPGGGGAVLLVGARRPILHWPYIWGWLVCFVCALGLVECSLLLASTHAH